MGGAVEARGCVAAPEGEGGWEHATTGNASILANAAKEAIKIAFLPSRFMMGVSRLSSHGLGPARTVGLRSIAHHL
jgi:hypothetical protein